MAIVYAICPSLALAFLVADLGADVSYQEEVVNSGMGPSKIGARKTLKSIYIKGNRQHVRSEIVASKKVLKKLSQQGTTVDASTILQLDRLKLLEIDNHQMTFSQRRLGNARMPPGLPAAAIPRGAVSSKLVTTDKNREINFRTRSLPDTLRIEGILCRRVAAELVARHYRPGTKTVRRENRYLYQAWVATDFPGYEEICRFNNRQLKKTSLPLATSGGLDQLDSSIEDFDDLDSKIAKLEGFAIQSELKVFSKASGKKGKQLLHLQRKVSAIAQTPLPDSLFVLSKGLRPTAR